MAKSIGKIKRWGLKTKKINNQIIKKGYFFIASRLPLSFIMKQHKVLGFIGLY
jgi:hypothetical protein